MILRWLKRDKRTEQLFFSTPQAIDFKLQCLVINLHQKINRNTDWGSEKPVLATCSQSPQTI